MSKQADDLKAALTALDAKVDAILVALTDAQNASNQQDIQAFNDALAQVGAISAKLP